MNDKDADRVVMARAIMWDRATGDEQAKWLRRVDDTLASLERAAATEAPTAPSAEEGSGSPTLRVVP